MSRIAKEFRSAMVDADGNLTAVWQRKLSTLRALDDHGAFASETQQIVMGAESAPQGIEPLTLKGAGAGVSLDDRAGSAYPRWAFYANLGIARIWNGTNGDLLTVLVDGKTGIGTATPHSQLAVIGLPVYANNAAAIAGGLTAGDFYRTGADPDTVCVVH